MRSPRAAARSLAVCALLITSGVAFAKEDPYRLEWQDSEVLRCSDRTAFSSALQSRLGRTVFDDDASVAISIRSFASEHHWQLSLTLETTARDATRRVLEGPVGDCSGLIAGALLTLELLLSAGTPATPAGTQAPESDGSSLPGSSPPQAIRPESDGLSTTSSDIADRARRTGDPDRRETGPRVELSARALIHLATLPGSGVGAGVAGALEYSPRLWLHLGVARSMPATTALPVRDDRIASTFTLSHANLALTWAALETHSSRLRIGVEGHLGSLGTEVSGAAPSGSDQHAWTALGATAGLLTRPVGPVHATLAASLLFPLSAREFGVREGPVLATLPQLGGWIEWAIGVHW